MTISPTRPKWMATWDEVHNAMPVPEWRANGDVSPTCVCADCLHYRTGLRAQIAVLEEMREKLTDEMTSIGDGQFFDKIEALRKELGA